MVIMGKAIPAVGEVGQPLIGNGGSAKPAYPVNAHDRYM